MMINLIEVGEIKFLSCIFVVNIGNQLEFTFVVSHKFIYIVTDGVIFLRPSINQHESLLLQPVIALFHILKTFTPFEEFSQNIVPYTVFDLTDCKWIINNRLSPLFFVHALTSVRQSSERYIHRHTSTANSVKDLCIHSFIHSLVFSLRGRVGRNQSSVMWPVWLWHTASWASSWG